MNNVELKIYDYSIDDTGHVIDDEEAFKPSLSSNTVISLNKDVFDLLDVTKQSGEFTYSFILPATPETMKFFNNFGTLNYVGRANYISYRSSLTKDGVDIFSGRFVLQSFDQNTQEYKGQLFGRLAYLINSLKDKKVKDLDYFTPFTHQYTNVTDTIMKSWEGKCQKGYGFDPTAWVNSNLEFFYPIVDMSGMGYFHNENIQDDGSNKYVPFHTPFINDTGDDVILTPFNGGEFPVAIKLLPVIEHILSEAGFIYDMSHFHTSPYNNKWENAFIQLPKLLIDDKYKAQARTDGDITNTYQEVFTGPNGNFTYTRDIKLDSWSDMMFVNGTRYRVPVNGDYKIRTVFDIDFTENGLNGTENENSRIFLRVMRKLYSDSSTQILIEVELTAEGEYYSPQPSPPFTLVDAKAKDEIYLTITGEIAVFSPIPLTSSVTIKSSSFMDIVSTPNVSSYGKRYLGDYFQDMTQLDLLKEFLTLSKSVIDYTEYNDELNIQIKPLLTLWQDNSIPQMDITDKIDRSSKFEVRPAIELMPRVISFEWKEGKDILNKSFLSKVGRNYGSTDYVGTNMMYAGKEFKVKSSKFIPYPTGAINWSDDMTDDFTDLICFKGFKDIEKFDESMDDFSLFLWDGVIRSITDTFKLQGIKSAVNDSINISQYPMCSNLLLTSPNYSVYKNTEDINWEWSVPYSIDSVEPTPDIGNQLYDLYYRKFIDALYVYDTIIVDTSVILTSREFSNLNIWAPVMLDGSRYRILDYKDYDVIGNKPMSIKLLKDNVGEGVTLAPEIPIRITTNYNINNVLTSDTIEGAYKYYESDILGTGTVTSFSYDGEHSLTTGATFLLPDNSVYGYYLSDFIGTKSIYNKTDASVNLVGTQVGDVISITIDVIIKSSGVGNPSTYSVKFRIGDTTSTVMNRASLIDIYKDTTYKYKANAYDDTFSSITKNAGSQLSNIYSDTKDNAGKINIECTSEILPYTPIKVYTKTKSVLHYFKDISVGDILINNNEGTGTCVNKEVETITVEFTNIDTPYQMDIFGSHLSTLNVNSTLNEIDITPQYRDRSDILRPGTPNQDITSYITDEQILNGEIITEFKVDATKLLSSTFTLSDTNGNIFNGTYDDIVLDQVLITDPKYIIKVKSITPSQVIFVVTSITLTYDESLYNLKLETGNNSVTVSVIEALSITSIYFDTNYLDSEITTIEYNLITETDEHSSFDVDIIEELFNIGDNLAQITVWHPSTILNTEEFRLGDTFTYSQVEIGYVSYSGGIKTTVIEKKYTSFVINVELVSFGDTGKTLYNNITSMSMNYDITEIENMTIESKGYPKLDGPLWKVTNGGSNCEKSIYSDSPITHLGYIEFKSYWRHGLDINKKSFTCSFEDIHITKTGSEWLNDFEIMYDVQVKATMSTSQSIKFEWYALPGDINYIYDKGLHVSLVSESNNHMASIWFDRLYDPVYGIRNVTSTFNETTRDYVISWDAAPGATSYTVCYSNYNDWLVVCSYKQTTSNLSYTFNIPWDYIKVDLFPGVRGHATLGDNENAGLYYYSEIVTDIPAIIVAAPTVVKLGNNVIRVTTKDLEAPDIFINGNKFGSVDYGEDYGEVTVPTYYDTIRVQTGSYSSLLGETYFLSLTTTVNM